MKRMHTKNEIEAIAEEAGGGFDPASIPEGEIAQSGIIGVNADGEAVKGSLFGKYVRILKASEIDPSNLTAEQYDCFKSGVFIDGELLGVKNPVFFPLNGAGTEGGYIRANQYGGISIAMYAIANEKVLTYTSDSSGYLSVDRGSGLNLGGWNGIVSLLGKRVPAFPMPSPDGRVFRFIYDGALKWQESNGLYLHNLTFTDSTSATRYLSVITDSATPFEIVSGTGPTLVQCADASILIVPDSGKSLPMYNNKSFHPTVYSLSFPSGSTSVGYTSYEISTLDQDEVKPL